MNRMPTEVRAKSIFSPMPKDELPLRQNLSDLFLNRRIVERLVRLAEGLEQIRDLEHGELGGDRAETSNGSKERLLAHPWRGLLRTASTEKSLTLPSSESS